MVRCTAVPDTRCELIPTSPSWLPVVIRVELRRTSRSPHPACWIQRLSRLKRERLIKKFE
ncbi:hypothetical protein E4K65_06115 [Bradyrhizobium niftali]|uniref:Uncharacterized protein n=1 Tax=Bradyrhizobium niftali TaxID=2560055 RepID=A0A4Y9M3F7_9BRAD|nr:hypothetical protein E4K65_06115 [Bradyrhizobium niftali]